MAFGSLRKMNRTQAALGHFGLSLIILVVLLAFMLYAWFPGKMFLYDGGLQGLQILIPVDLVLGPLLTLIIFNPKKKELALDLSLIFAVQLAALTWGMFQIYQLRTHFLVYDESANTVVSVKYHELHNIEAYIANATGQALAAPKRAWYQPPEMIALRAPQTSQELARRKEAIKAPTLAGGGAIYHYDQYTDISNTKLQDGQPVNILFYYTQATGTYNKEKNVLENVEAVEVAEQAKQG